MRFNFFKRGRASRVTFEEQLNDDWLDPAIFEHLQDLLVTRNTGRRFVCIDFSGGQQVLIACSTPAQMKSLRAETGLKVESLS